MGPCQLRLAAAALVVPVFGITLALAADETFTKPTFKGYRLAYCIDRGSGCGKRAANALCQYLGLGDASKFAVDPDVGRKTPTRIDRQQSDLQQNSLRRIQVCQLHSARYRKEDFRQSEMEGLSPRLMREEGRGLWLGRGRPILQSERLRQVDEFHSGSPHRA